MKYRITPVTYSVHLEKDNPIFGESVVQVTLDDEAGGPFIILKQVNEHDNGTVRLDFDEFQTIVEAVASLKLGLPPDYN